MSDWTEMVMTGLKRFVRSSRCFSFREPSGLLSGTGKLDGDAVAVGMAWFPFETGAGASCFPSWYLVLCFCVSGGAGEADQHVARSLSFSSFFEE